MTRAIREQEILGALARRFDHESAANMLKAALAHAGIAPAPSYAPADVSRIAWAVSELEQRAQPAVSALLGLATKGATGGPPGTPDELDDEAPLGPGQDDGLVAAEALGALLPQIVQAAVESVKMKREARAAEEEDTPEKGAGGLVN